MLPCFASSLTLPIAWILLPAVELLTKPTLPGPTLPIALLLSSGDINDQKGQSYLLLPCAVMRRREAYSLGPPGLG